MTAKRDPRDYPAQLRGLAGLIARRLYVELTLPSLNEAAIVRREFYNFRDSVLANPDVAPELTKKLPLVKSRTLPHAKVAQAGPVRLRFWIDRTRPYGWSQPQASSRIGLESDTTS